MSTTPPQESERLARLIADDADPVIEGILRRVQIRSGFEAEDADDVRATVHLRLIERLSDDARAPIESFRDFVAVTTYHAVDDLLRRRYPERARLKARIRHLLSTDPRFTTIHEGRQTLAALVRAEGVSSNPAGDDLAALLARAGKPIDLDELVTLAAERWRIPLGAHAAAPLDESFADRETDASSRLESRQSLALLWSEIKALPQDQRVALLLNLRDAQRDSAIALFIFSGIATIEELAECAGMPQTQFESLWTDLPLEDSRIAELLGVSRQQVINLRKSARMRLARRKSRGRF